MFTGIIQAVGSIGSLESRNGDAHVRVDTGTLVMDDVCVGDSIAVNGVCLTALQPDSRGFWADVSGETLARTTLGELRCGDHVNLEKALRPQDRLGGHIVSGHVDGVGQVLSRRTDARSVQFRIDGPTALARYIAEKGSICVNGVSLTVNAVHGASFDLNIVPHTQSATTLDALQAGQRVNLEVDLIARYLERLLLGDRAADTHKSSVTREFLAENGFLKKN